MSINAYLRTIFCWRLLAISQRALQAGDFQTSHPRPGSRGEKSMFNPMCKAIQNISQFCIDFLIKRGHHLWMSSPDFWTENPGLQAKFFLRAFTRLMGWAFIHIESSIWNINDLFHFFFNLLFVYICLLLCWSNCPNIENDIRSTLHDRCWWKVGKSAFPYHQQSPPVEPLAALGVAFVLSEVMSWAEYPVGLFNGQCVCVCVYGDRMTEMFNGVLKLCS